MTLIGKIYKHGSWYVVEVDAIGVYTQGHTRAEAEAMLIDAVQEVVHRDGFTVTVSRYGDGHDVLIDASDSAALAAYVLRYQREMHGLSLADVARKLGASSRTAYARYEQGDVAPSMEKYMELLAAVAPELAITVGPRKPARAAPAEGSAAKRRTARTQGAR